MSDKPRKPPLRPKGDGPELVRIGEDTPAPDTERVPIPLPHPKTLPSRPPIGVVGVPRAPNLLDEVHGLRDDVAAIYAGQREMLATQRKMARQTDGLGQRFDVFHEELALLRATVEKDVEPRLGKVESTLGQKAAKGGGLIALAVVALPMLADALPKYAHLFDAVLRGLQ